MRFAKIIGILMVVLLLSGCAEHTALRPTTDAGHETMGGESVKELTILSYDAETLARYAAAAQAQYGVQLEFAEPDNSAYDQMLLDFAAGKGTYDIVCIDNMVGNLYTADGLIDRGYFAPLGGNEQIARALRSMLPVLQQQAMRSGEIYALPYFVHTKVLEFDRALYTVAQSGDYEAYTRWCGTEFTREDAEKLPEMREYGSWQELMDTGAMHKPADKLAPIAMLEQYTLAADQADFTFDCAEFQSLLELMKRCELNAQTEELLPIQITTGGVTLYSENWLDEVNTDDLFLLYEYLFAPPTADAQDRLAMSYGVMAINAFSGQKDQALLFLESAAKIMLEGDPDFDVKKDREFPNAVYGSVPTARCFTDEAHLIAVAGNDPENQKRWLELTQRLAPITNTGYLTSFYLEIYPMFRDGAITAEQCARMTQERFEIYKAEQGR